MLALLADNSKRAWPRRVGTSDFVDRSPFPESKLVQNLDEKFYLRPYLFDERATLANSTFRWTGVEISPTWWRLCSGPQRKQEPALAAVVFFSNSADDRFRSY